MTAIFRTYLLLSLVFISSNLFAQWSQLDGPVGGNFRCLEKVGSQVWAGCNSGMYYSDNEGLTWERSTLFYGACNDIQAWGDTVMICYVEIEGTAYNLKTISSFDGGLTFGAPVFIEATSSILPTAIYKTQNAIYVMGDWDAYISLDGGISWTLDSGLFGQGIYTISSNGTSAFAEFGMVGAPYVSTYFSPTGTAPWIFMDSSQAVYDLFIEGGRIFLHEYDPPNNLQRWFKTDDFGTTWDTSVVIPFNSYAGFIYTYNGSLYVSNYFDAWVSNDNGDTWTQTAAPSTFAYREGVMTSGGNKLCVEMGDIVTYIPPIDTFIVTMTGTSSHNITGLFANNNILFATDYELLFRSSDGGITWSEQNICNTPIEELIFRGDTIYGINSDYYGVFMKSFDNGITWDTISVPLNTSWTDLPSVTELNGRIFITGDEMLYSDDLGLTWNQYTPLPTGTIGNCSLTSMDNVGLLNTFNNELYAINNSGFIFKYDTLSQTWENIFCFWSTGANNQNKIIPLDDKLMMNARRYLFVSADSGATWVESSYGGLPQNGSSPYVPKNVINIGNLWFGTCGDYGVYMSTDFGDTWQPMNVNPEFYAAGGLISLNGVLFSGSYNDGVWRRQSSFFTVNGKIYHDLNANNIQDTGEPGLNGFLVNTNPSSFVGTSNATGDYSLTTDINGTINAVLPGTYGSYTPASYSISGAASGLDFAFTMPPDIYDLQVDMTNVNVFRPGFQTSVIITARNVGSVVQAAEIKLVLDTAVQFDSAIPVPDLVTTDTIYWTTSNLDFLETATVNVTVTTKVGTPLGTLLSSDVTVFPVSVDTMPTDNYCTLRDSVVGSYDPNDKTCVQGDYFTPAQLNANEDFEYIIRFQNTGTFPTAFVTVTDTLSGFFDWTTFRLVSASHQPMEWTLSTSGVLEVEFDPLFLPPSSVDELGSHGYIKFAVKCKPTVTLGTAIENTANIYFDFNSPIITNTVLTLVSDPIPVPVQEIRPTPFNILPYPNPAAAEINLRINGIDKEPMHLAIFNSMGQLVLQQDVVASPHKIDLAKLQNGFYIGKLANRSGNKSSSFRFIKQE